MIYKVDKWVLGGAEAPPNISELEWTSYNTYHRAGAAPQRVVGQLQKDAHARARTTCLPHPDPYPKLTALVCNGA